VICKDKSGSGSYLGFLIAVVKRWFPALYPASFHLELGYVRSEDKGTNEGTNSKPLCSLKDLRLLGAL
jgi:hypothetical protein